MVLLQEWKDNTNNNAKKKQGLSLKLQRQNTTMWIILYREINLEITTWKKSVHFFSKVSE